MALSERQAALCEDNKTNFSDLRAVFFNCTLKRPDQPSHTSLLMGASAEIMRKTGIAVEEVRMTAHTVAFGVQPDMRKHGWDRDDWPDLWRKVEAADILVIGTPIWLGEQSSVCRLLIERLYAMSGMLNNSNPPVRTAATLSFELTAVEASGGQGGYGLSLLPVPGQEFVEALEREVGDAGEDVGKLKLLKRQMYGRAKVDLLEARLMSAA